MEEKLTAAERKRIASLDRQIEKLGDKAAAKKKEYDELTDQLMHLLDERYPERKAERVKESLYQAFLKGGLSLEQALELLSDPGSIDEW